MRVYIIPAFMVRISTSVVKDESDLDLVLSCLEVSRESVTCDVCDLNGQCLAMLHSAASVGVAVVPEPHVFPFEVA